MAAAICFWRARPEDVQMDVVQDAQPAVVLPQCMARPLTLGDVALDAEVAGDAALGVVEAKVVSLDLDRRAVEPALVGFHMQTAVVEELAPDAAAMRKIVLEQIPRRSAEERLTRGPVLGQHRVVDLGDPLVLEHVVEDAFLVDRVVPLDRLVDHHEEETVQRLRKEELETIVSVHRQPGNSISVLQWISRERMPAANDLRSILNAAEQAAARDDVTAAEQLLREALALQESTAGSPRDEIAKTLNNLAVVCEMTGKLKDAETCYRRAHKIAMASLPASDPFVTTSRENLEAFCTSQGLPLVPEPPPAPPRVEPSTPQVAPPERSRGSSDPPTPTPVRAQPATATAPRAPSTPPRPAPPAPRQTSAAPQPPRLATAVPAKTPRGPSRVVIVGVLLLSAVAIGIVIARNWLVPSAADRAETISQSEPVASVPPPADVPAPTPSPVPPPAPEPQPEPVAAAPSPAAPTPEPPRATASPSEVSVVSAQLCRSLTTTGAWRCETASGTQAPGTLHFYTRVASARDTVVEHRWYQDDRLHQRVELRIRANAAGFRTYSRNTIGPDRAGQWKVELRDSDGRLLEEETFVVQ